MCGIGSITTTKTASPSTLALLNHAATVLLDALDHRGGDACGILTISANGRNRITKAPCDARAFNQGRGSIPADTRALAVHTRFATSGEPHWNRNNHPVVSGRALVLHNGVIWDYRNPRAMPHGEPEVDTYLLALAAAPHANRNQNETAQAHAERAAAAMVKEEGSAAVLLAYKGQPFLAACALDGSPLYTAEHQGVRVCASTREAVLKTFDALRLTLPSIPYSYTKTIKKAKHGRPAKTKLVHSTREAVYYAPEGTILTWNAGTHTAGTIEMPTRVQPARHWTNHGIGADGSYASAWSNQEDDDAWHDTRISTIAARMLEAEDFRCELCDETTNRLTPAYGMLCCDSCISAMDDQPETLALKEQN